MDCAIVYRTAALASDRVVVAAEIPADRHSAIRYEGAVLAGSSRREAAGFLDFLGSAGAEPIWKRFGFEL